MFEKDASTWRFIYRRIHLRDSRRTAELTWGETDYTQAKGNKTS
jgi:hypothetical protein